MVVTIKCLKRLLQLQYDGGPGWLNELGRWILQLAQSQWFSPDTPTSSTTKTGRHDIAEIFLKMALNNKIQIQIQYDPLVQ